MSTNQKAEGAPERYSTDWPTLLGALRDCYQEHQPAFDDTINALQKNRAEIEKAFSTHQEKHPQSPRLKSYQNDITTLMYQLEGYKELCDLIFWKLSDSRQPTTATHETARTTRGSARLDEVIDSVPAARNLLNAATIYAKTLESEIGAPHIYVTTHAGPKPAIEQIEFAGLKQVTEFSALQLSLVMNAALYAVASKSGFAVYGADANHEINPLTFGLGKSLEGIPEGSLDQTIHRITFKPGNEELRPAVPERLPTLLKQPYTEHAGSTGSSRPSTLLFSALGQLFNQKAQTLDAYYETLKNWLQSDDGKRRKRRLP